MALVKISKKLIVDVDTQVITMDAVAAASGYKKVEPEGYPAAVAELAKLAVAEWFSDAPEVLALIPSKWLTEGSRIYAEVSLPDSLLPVLFRVPGTFLAPQHVKPGYSDPTFEVDTSLLTPETLEVVMTYCTRRQEHERRYIEVRKQVKAYLETSISLNSAVKRFPARVPRPAEVKAVAAEGEVDKALLSVVGAMHQLGS